jgi:hypothetical protein
MPWDDGFSPFPTSLRRDGGGHPTPAPAELVVVDLVAQHNEQSHEQLPGDGDFGFGTPAPMHDREVGSLEVDIHAGRMRRGLPEGETEERAALLGDVAEVIFVGGRIQGGGQSDVADHVLAVGEAGHGPQHDDGGKRGHGPDAGMGDQTQSIGVRQGRRCDRVVERTDLHVESCQQFETLITALRGVRGQREGLQLCQAGLAEQLGATGESVVEGDGVQTILDHGADADEAHAVREERAQIPSGGIWHPDRREAIVAQQVEDVQSVAPIGLRLAHDHGANPGRIADKQCVPEALHERVKPDGVARALNPDRHRPRQCGIELFDRRACQRL